MLARALKLCLATVSVCAAASLCVAQAPAPAVAAPGAPLSLAECVAFAKAHNPTLAAARAHAAGIHANEITASLRQNPELNLGGTDVSLPANNPSSPYSYSVGVSRLFERGQKRRWRMESAANYSKAADAQLADTERQTVLDVKQNFTQLLEAQAKLDLAKQDLDSYSKTLDLSKARLNAGDISGTDYSQLDLQMAQFESDYEDAFVDLRQQSDQLQLALGIEHPSTRFAIIGDLAPPALDHDLAALITLAEKARPDVIEAEANAAAAQFDLKLAVANGTADPTLAGEYDRTGVYNSAGFSISIPLRIFDRNQGEKQRTAMEAQSQQLTAVATRNQAESDVDQAWAQYVSASKLSARYRTHYLDEAQTVRNNLEFSFQHGSATLLDFLQSLRDYRQTRLNAVQADAQVWLAIHQLSFATATELVP